MPASILPPPPSEPAASARRVVLVSEKPRPLLPPVLTGPASFLWLWVLPVALLFALNVQGYHLISGNLSAKQHELAWMLGGALLLDLGLGVAAWATSRRWMRAGREAAARHALWGVPLIAAHVAYLWMATAVGEDLLPASVTAWIYPGTRYLFNQYAFAMVPLFTGMLRLACAGSANLGGRAVAWHVSAAVLVPTGLYLAGVLLRGSDLPYWRIPETILAMGMVGFGLLLFVCVVRVVMLALGSEAMRGPTGRRAGIVIFALALPLAGLGLNDNIPFPADFQAPEVYALTVANAVLLFVSTLLTTTRPRLALFLLGATLPFTLYFFVVFLPYTPLAVLAILALGAGFLILAPTLLFTLHLHLAWESAREAALAAPGRGWRLAAVGLAGCAVLPGWFTARGLSDRAALNVALEHAFTPAVSGAGAAYPGSLTHLRRAVSSHRAYKDGLYYPLLSDYYAWLVFDGLVLPDEKLNRIESLFFGKVTPSDASRGDGFGFGARTARDRHRMPRATNPPRTVEVREIRAATRPAGEGATTVTLALTLENTGEFGQAEYVRTLPLAPGVVANGFRLHVNGEPVPGRIVEKKTALWVYAMIRDSERRDPGLLFYNAPDQLELRVFPVVAGTPSIVELDFLVPAGSAGARALPVETLDPAACAVALRDWMEPVLARPSADTAVLAGVDRERLPVVARPAYVHFLVNRSADNAFTGDIAAARAMLAGRLDVVGPARVTLVNHDVVSVEPREGVAFPPDAEGIARALPAGGGLHLDLAFAQALRRHRDEDLDRLAPDAPPPARPVFVILSRRLGTGVGELSLANEWADLVPGIEAYELDETGELRSCFGEPAPETPMLRLGASARPWLAWAPTRFEGAESGATPAYWDEAAGRWRALDVVEAKAGRGVGADDTGEASWPEAMALLLRHQDAARDPGRGGSVATLRALVDDSRRLGVLTPATSFIVVENAAQWRAMEQAEKKKLGEHQALDHLETPAPPAVWVLIGFGGWIGVRRAWAARSRRRASGCSCV